MPTLIFDGDHIQVLYDNRGTDTVMMTFNEMGSVANGRNYWAEAVCRNLGISCIGVMAKARNWFPQIEMQAAMYPIRRLREPYRYAITYGYSQGAYGALKYSKAADATHVLAFSPQWTIDPRTLLGIDSRFSANFREELNVRMEITAPDLSGTVRVFVDQGHATDYYHARIIANLVDYKCIVPCFDLNHDSVRVVSSTAAMRSMLAILRDDDADLMKLFQQIKSAKKETFAYLFWLGQKAVRLKHKATARALYLRAAAMIPNHPFLVGWAVRIQRDFGGACLD